jgi:preprotein translocase subunit SecG
MDTLNIVTVIAIILFARLGIRLVYIYRKYKKEEKDKK